jgi:putative selenium metabolism hydrolase
MSSGAAPAMPSHLMDTDRLVAFTQALVRLPSLSGEEEKVAACVLEEMRSLGFDRVDIDANGSVVGVIDGSRPGPTLLFDAHIDTVGISPAVPWRFDPHGGAIDDAEVPGGAIYGRGSADMKGALAAMVHAAAGLDRSRLAGRVVVSASTMEEVLEGVTLKTVMDAVQPDFVVIGESTNLNLARGGRGRAELHLRTVGKPSHSSSPHLGRNAVLDMMRVIAAIDTLSLPEDPLLGPAILALTDIISEPYPGNSVIPSLCRVTYDRRLLAGETAETVLRAITELPGLGDIRLEAQIGEVGYRAYTGASLSAHKFFPAWVLAEEHHLVQRALAGLVGLGMQPTLGAYRFCTNAAYSAGVAGVPTIGFGPATEADAHVVDERLALRDLFAVAAGYRAICEALLG